ncbi:sarcosine dehydrogenase, mitochondrial-like isoform X2 [Augochlora pura]
MFRLIKTKVNARCIICMRSVATIPQGTQTSSVQLPSYADVIIIGGGSAGCNALYHLGRSGIKAVLVDKSKLISGTTWHTAGLVWGIRGPYDVEMQLLSASKRVLNRLQDETGIHPGWINNGGLIVARTSERLNECKRLVSVSNAFDIGARLISPKETKDLFPLLDENCFRGAIYSPTDGVVDPSMLINALVKSARNNGCQVIEDCPVSEILVDDIDTNKKKVRGINTPYGIIKSDVVLNAAGVWSKKVVNTLNLDIPLVPIKHAYIVTEPMTGVEQQLPNIRDPDGSLYFRIQGNSIAAGYYERCPILIGSAPDNFSFSLYELDWDICSPYIDSMTELIPNLSKTGIRTTICGPESFTPDHKPLMGEDPRCSGLFYSCGYNSAGMMLGGGCGEQISRWIINGRPDNYMFNYDIRRFITEQRNNLTWMTERSYEAYAKNYNIIFPHDEPLSGRNLKTDPFHNLLVEEGAIMEERQGWERPGWFYPSQKVQIIPYNYEKSCETLANEKDEYREILEKEYSFELSSFNNIIRDEVLACRNNVSLFNMSYLGKFYLCGPGAQEAADYLFTADTRCNTSKTIYTCMLNKTGGVEMDCTVTILEPGSGGVINPIFKDTAFYIGYHLWGSDVRTDDNPIEAGLGFVCRKHGHYQGKSAIDQLRQNGIKKKLMHFHVDSGVSLWGLEPIYRNDVLVGYLRRAEQGYSCDNTIGRGYVKHPNGENITEEFLKNGNYEIEVMGKRYKAESYLKSPFDSQNKRIQGIYENRSNP